MAVDSQFEFAALRRAQNYRKALLREFSPYLSGDILEVGAGIGQFSELIARLANVRKLTAIEPSAAFCEQLSKQIPRHKVIQGTVADVEPGTQCNAIVSVNVLEHIEHDEGELSVYSSLLKKRRGVLCLFVPARPELYSLIDRDFGHFRRYTKAQLAKKLQAAGFSKLKIHYFNWAGYFGWWLTFRTLKKRTFSERSVRLFDTFVFPPMNWFESRIVRPPIGQSLLVVAQSNK